jgi:N-acetylglucosaminyl-diphospho-decaprenol L-rhamnosyltransferase
MMSKTFSVISHGHGASMGLLLSQMNEEAALTRARVVVTINIPEEFDPQLYPNLDLVVLRNSSPKGFGANHNAAFAHCMTEWFVVLNPDLELDRGEPFSHLEIAASSTEQVGVIAPLVTNSKGAREDSVRANLTPLSLFGRHFLGRRAAPAIGEPARRGSPFYWLGGMCLMVRADAFRAIKGFDERFFLYCEDYDLCARLYREGYALAVDSSVRIVHNAQRDSHRSARHLAWHVKSLLRVWSSRVYWAITLGGITRLFLAR